MTNYGPFVVRMDRANAPCGVHNFVHLVTSRFYPTRAGPLPTATRGRDGPPVKPIRIYKVWAH